MDQQVVLLYAHSTLFLGISYNLGRVPIASCDFSLSNYSYLDKYGDFELESFSLQTLDSTRVDFEFNFYELLRF